MSSRFLLSLRNKVGKPRDNNYNNIICRSNRNNFHTVVGGKLSKQSVYYYDKAKVVGSTLSPSITTSCWWLRYNNNNNNKCCSQTSIRRYSQNSSNASSTVGVDANNNDNNTQGGEKVDEYHNNPDNDNKYPQFKDLSDIHPSTKKALVDVLGLTTMTEIQYKTFHAAVQGKDVLGRARTGTGKTLAFLLPSLERILRQSPPTPTNHLNSDDTDDTDDTDTKIEILIISPTRELAIQIGQQVQSLLSVHNQIHNKNKYDTVAINSQSKKISYQVMYGGSPRKKDVKMLHRRLPTILVATPGRLQDHLSSTSINDQPFADIIQQNLQVLVLDETDRLLDMGFRKEIDQIMSHLPNSDNRQTLLFSATMPKQLRQLLSANNNNNKSTIMQPDYVTIDCIQDKDPASHTNAQVQQSHVILPTSQRLVSGPVELLMRLMDREPKHKIVAFFPTAHLVSFYSNLFNFGLDRKVIEMHSRKSQDYRTKMSNLFRKTDTGVLFTTDVSARGVDYPDVTHVIQFGICDSRETYIHRLGRTGRAGKKGQGILVLSEEEEIFLKILKGLDIPQNEELQEWVAKDTPPSPRIMSKLEPVLQSIKTGQNHRLKESAEKAYRSLLGFYSNQFIQIGVKCKNTVVQKINAFASQSGLETPPPIHQHLIKNMGLQGVPGLSISIDMRFDPNHGKKHSKATALPTDTSSYNNWGRSGSSKSNSRSEGKTEIGISSSEIRRTFRKQPRRGIRRT
uniref:ATP-dependent RNA helicase n=1 Tax=Eucampia antarctica TaxID=49252 RepID=A0A7S2W602_9STRA|mmetsp:Transcript_21845/g.20967  ORF Transcript_21845/g.20967 Transcript_21845/m.20967 type:complete len:737 (+) Transcript_21845:79-2289(+)